MAYWVVLDSEYDGVRKTAELARRAVIGSRRPGSCMVGPYPSKAEARQALLTYRGKGAVSRTKALLGKSSLGGATFSEARAGGLGLCAAPEAWVDGSASPKDGVSAWGGVIAVPDGRIVPFMGRVSGLSGCGTSADAELRACVAAVEAAVQLGIPSLVVWTDLDHQLIEGLSDPSFPTKRGAHALLATLVRTNAGGRARVTLRHVPSHAGVIGNELADALAAVARLGGSVSDVLDDGDVRH